MFHGFIFWLLTQNRAFKFLDKEKLWKFWIILQEYGYSTWLLCDIIYKDGLQEQIQAYFLILVLVSYGLDTLEITGKHGFNLENLSKYKIKLIELD